MPRLHRTTYLRRRAGAVAAVVLVVGLIAAVVRHSDGSQPQNAHRDVGSGQSTTTSSGRLPTASPSSAGLDSRSAGPSRRTNSPSRTAPTARAQAREAAEDVIAEHGSGTISVAVTNLSSGASFTAGSTGGMRLASVAKVEILETLLLQDGGTLSDQASSCAVPMIEQSDNDAADDCFAVLGGTAAYSAAGPRLGLSTATTYGQGYYWGLDTSCASDQVRLLRNLVQLPSPLTASARQLALHLLRSVEADQRWGVPVVADDGTAVAVKDGWLGVDADGGRWAVNSDGIVSYHGAELAMSVLTQHNADEASGIALIQKLAPLLAEAVAGD